MTITGWAGTNGCRFLRDATDVVNVVAELIDAIPSTFIAGIKVFSVIIITRVCVFRTVSIDPIIV